MTKNNLSNIIRKQHLPRLIFLTVSIIITVALFIINPATRETVSVTEKNLELTQQLFNNDKNHIQLTLSDLHYSGLDYKAGNSVKARLYYKLHKGKCYFILLDKHILPDDYKELSSIEIKAFLDYDVLLLNNALFSTSEKLSFSEANLKEMTMPFIINQYKASHDFVSFIKNLCLVLICVISTHFLYILLIFFKPHFSRSVLVLHKYGKAGHLFALAEKEFDDSPLLIEHRLFVTKTFLIIFSHLSVDIIPIENIVWIYNYHEFKKKRGDSLIYSPMCIVSDCKKMYKIPHVSKNVYDAIANVLTDTNPQIMVGNEK